MKDPLSGLSFINTLRFRVLVMLTLAMLPIGLIAVIQTKQLAKTARDNAELALLAKTEKASLSERVVIEQARGAARVMGYLIRRLADPEQCERYMKRYLRANTQFSFVGVTPKSGIMVCSSAGGVTDFSENESFQRVMRTQESNVFINRTGQFSKASVIVVSEPYFEEGEIMGVISVSVPHSKLKEFALPDDGEGFINVLTFNAEGDVLTAQNDLDVALLDIPRDRKLSDLVGQGTFSFTEPDTMGRMRTYSVAPIVENVVYTLGVWRRGAVREDTWRTLPSWLFPMLMWLSSLGVALFAVHRLVTRHVRRLGYQMNAFARSRALPRDLDATAAPAELLQLQGYFHNMADAIMQDEARLENHLRDSNVLLKEVHHRVKNNLQLISSIINMQIRKSDTAEAKQVLGRVQDRVLSLATIHRDLYQSRDAGRVDVGALVREISEKSIEIGTDDGDSLTLKLNIDPVMLYPDQAVPASLLTAEAATNAMKYVGPDEGGRRWVDVTLKMVDETHCYLSFANSIGRDVGAESTGLGAQLIRAFSLQMGGEIEVEQTARVYRMSITFPIADFVSDVVDY